MTQHPETLFATELAVGEQPLVDLLLASGAVIHNGRVQTFGAAHAEWTALAHAGVVPLLGATPLQLTGADRLDFLHGQISNEVKRLPVGSSCSALMLNVRGHALALMRVYRRDDDLFVSVEGGAGAEVEAQLREHIIFDQVELTNLQGTLTALTLQGSSAATIVKQVFDVAPPEAEQFIQVSFAGAKVLLAANTRGAADAAAGGFDLHVLSQHAPALLRALQAAGATFAGEAALDAHRVAAGLADAEHEGGEGVLPQEAGLDYAVSYRKGCYLGQEIMARIEARGKPRRRLVGLKLDGAPSAGARDLVLNGKTVGRLGSVAGHPLLGTVALGSVRTEIPEGTDLELGPVRARVRSLPLEP